MRILSNVVIYGIAALCLGLGLFVMSFDYPHTWMPCALSFFIIWFFVRATWLPTIAFRFSAAAAGVMSVTGLFLISSVQRMNIFQRERPIVLDVMVTLGLVATVVAFGLIFLAPRQRRAPAFYVFVALLMTSLIAYVSSSKGGPSPMLEFFQRVFGLSESGAEAATIAVRKAVHFTYYGTLALVVYLGARAGKVPKLTAFQLGLAAALAVACFDEVRQTTADFRSGSVWDIVLDLVGATTFCLIAAATKGVRSK